MQANAHTHTERYTHVHTYRCVYKNAHTDPCGHRHGGIMSLLQLYRNEYFISYPSSEEVIDYLPSTDLEVCFSCVCVFLVSGHSASLSDIYA